MDDKIFIEFMNEQSKSMGTVVQKVDDLHDRLSKAMPYLDSEIKEVKADLKTTNERLTNVEKTGLKAQGFAAAIGAVLGGTAGVIVPYLKAKFNI